MGCARAEGLFRGLSLQEQCTHSRGLPTLRSQGRAYPPSPPASLPAPARPHLRRRRGARGVQQLLQGDRAGAGLVLEDDLGEGVGAAAALVGGALKVQVSAHLQVGGYIVCDMKARGGRRSPLVMPTSLSGVKGQLSGVEGQGGSTNTVADAGAVCVL